MKARYEVREEAPTALALEYGRDYPLYTVWDVATNTRLSFGAYRTRVQAEARIKRMLDQGVG